MDILQVKPLGVSINFQNSVGGNGRCQHHIDIQISSSSTQSGFVNVACSKDYSCILHGTPGGVFKDSCQLRFLLGLPAQQLSPDDQGPVRIFKRSGRVDRILAGSVRRIHRNLRRRDFRSHRRSSALQRVRLPLRRVSGTPHAGPDVHVVEAGKMKFRFSIDTARLVENPSDKY